MSMWTKLIALMKGSINSAGEALIDSQAMSILDQEMRDASEGVKNAKDTLASVMAQERVEKAKAEKKSRQIEEYKSYAIKALEKGEESLAKELAEKILSEQESMSDVSEQIKIYTDNIESLQKTVAKAERNLKKIRQQIDTIKATEAVQRAQAAVAERHNGSNRKIKTAMDSLERIKDKQAYQKATLDAEREIDEFVEGNSLEAKLKKAGIVDKKQSVDDLLEQLKKSTKKKK